MGAKIAPEKEKEPKKLFSAELGKDGHYADLDLTRYFDGQLEPESANDVTAHARQCESCRKNADAIQREIWSRVKTHFKGF